MNTADDTKTFWATAKADGVLAEQIIELLPRAHIYWAAYGGESCIAPSYDIATGRFTETAYHRIEV